MLGTIQEVLFTDEQILPGGLISLCALATDLDVSMPPKQFSRYPGRELSIGYMRRFVATLLAGKNYWVEALYRRGDGERIDQTKHDRSHVLEVAETGTNVANAIRGDANLLINKELIVAIRLAAYLHDVGGIVGDKDHALIGARIAYLLLKQNNFPDRIIHTVCLAIAWHRSGHVTEHRCDSLVHAILVFADKVVGDEDRVRPEVLARLREMRSQRFNFHNYVVELWQAGGKVREGEPDLHDMVNFGITRSTFIIDKVRGLDETASTAGTPSKGTIYLQFRLKEDVVYPQDVCRLFQARYHAVALACKEMGYLFRLMFGEVIYRFHKDEEHPLGGQWLPLEARSARGGAKRRKRRSTPRSSRRW